MAILTFEICEAPHVVLADSRVVSVFGVVCGHAFLVSSHHYVIVFECHKSVLAIQY